MNRLFIVKLEPSALNSRKFSSNSNSFRQNATKNGKIPITEFSKVCIFLALFPSSSVSWRRLFWYRVASRLRALQKDRKSSFGVVFLPTADTFRPNDSNFGRGRVRNALITEISDSVARHLRVFRETENRVAPTQTR